MEVVPAYEGRGHSGGQMQIEATDASHKIIEGAIYLLKKHYLPQPVRSIGISAGKLRPKDYQQLSLFEDVEEVKEQESLDKAIDKIRERYGFGSLVHASLLPGELDRVIPRTQHLFRG